MLWAFQQRLDDRKQQGQYRVTQAFSGKDRLRLYTHGREYINFSSNDYLGLAGDPEVQAAFIEGAKLSGVGSGAAHLVTGHHEFHQALEERLASWLQRDDALLFSTGYMANLAVLSTFLDKEGVLLEDKWNHASLIDGARLSGARCYRYQHANIDHVVKRLRHIELKHPHKRALLATDAVFSMDGDITPLKDMLKLLKQADQVRVMVDDAHGVGVIGHDGSGTLNHLGISQKSIPLLVGTLGKALGTAGAFVAGPRDWIDYLRQFARPYIYTTGAPPAVAYATLKSIELAQAPERRARLKHHLNYFTSMAHELRLPLQPSATPIQPLIVGDAKKAVEMSRLLQAKGCWVSAIRPPTVPEGTARLRITLTSEHTQAQIDQLLEALSEAIKPTLGTE